MSGVFKNIFSGKEEEKKPVEKKAAVKEEKKVSEKPEVAKKEEKKEVKKDKKVEEPKKAPATPSYSYAGKSIIKEPLVTEKSRDMSMDGKYVFSVDLGTNKSEVKKEVEKRYNVTVEKVNITRKSFRPRRYRGQEGKIRKQKKAVVTLKEGDKIEIFPA